MTLAQFACGQEVKVPPHVHESGSGRVIHSEWGPDNRLTYNKLDKSGWIYGVRLEASGPPFMVSEAELLSWQ